MKKIVYALLATLSGLVLLFSYRTSLEAVQPGAALEPVSSSGTTTAGPTTSDASGSDDESDSGEASDKDSSDSSSSDTGTSSSGSDSTTSGLSDGTYTGGSANTRYGPVQVQITVSDGQIADVQVIDYPHSNGRDQAINQRAIPVLVSETTRAQSSQISMVSGATYTSQGYIASLQSAIDQASS
ncbi:FMN-binding protein [Microbacterium sp. SS28]|uniref:FMN-binding protein n=1 Tax=Microbacterium sp. SS28 TaxID=2919948 RepID=UPI001FAADD8D|nr:FMN-binding protein [Microbacterium sp. SS28]